VEWIWRKSLRLCELYTLNSRHRNLHKNSKYNAVNSRKWEIRTNTSNGISNQASRTGLPGTREDTEFFCSVLR
jgi:hypothetical protein